ncbi:MAG: hypothetical protein MZV70_12830 [Desulfobacterales bacterium]|nr:hypothetical protein [Desulfobacterales bacterium]
MDGQIRYLRCELFRYVRQELASRKRRRNLRSYDDLLADLRKALVSEGAEPSRGPSGKIPGGPHRRVPGYGLRAVRHLRVRLRAGGTTLLSDRRPETGHLQLPGSRSFRLHPRRLLRGAALHAGRELALGAGADPRRQHPLFPPEARLPLRGRALRGGAGRRARGPAADLWRAARGAAASVGPRRGGGTVSVADARERIRRAVAAEIARLVEAGRRGEARIGDALLREADVAVLVRTNREALLTQEALADLGVHSVVYTTGNLFGHPGGAADGAFAAGCRAQPNEETAVRTALATDLLGLDGAAIDGLMGDARAWEERLRRFHDWRDTWERHGFVRMFRELMAAEQVRPRLLSLPGGERRLTNVLHLAEVLHGEEMRPGAPAWAGSSSGWQPTGTKRPRGGRSTSFGSKATPTP